MSERRRRVRPHRRHPIAALGGRVRRLTTTQRTVVALMMAGAVAAAIALVALLSPAAPAPIGGAPLNNPSVPSVSASAGASAVPPTVRLVVPSVNINIAVVQGDGIHVPLNLAMHYPGTAQPGAGSNSLFYAHGQRGMFYGLYSVHTGAEIRAVRADGTVETYVVHEIREVPWNDLQILQPTPYEQIILLTCTSYDPYDPRLLIIGTPV